MCSSRSSLVLTPQLTEFWFNPDPALTGGVGGGGLGSLFPGNLTRFGTTLIDNLNKQLLVGSSLLSFVSLTNIPVGSLVCCPGSWI